MPMPPSPDQRPQDGADIFFDKLADRIASPTGLAYEAGAFLVGSSLFVAAPLESAPGQIGFTLATVAAAAAGINLGVNANTAPTAVGERVLADRAKGYYYAAALGFSALTAGDALHIAPLAHAGSLLAIACGGLGGLSVWYDEVKRRRAAASQDSTTPEA